MLEITIGEYDEIILSGRFDAAEAEKARQVFLNLTEAKVVDCARLDYISSAGLGVLLAALGLIGLHRGLAGNGEFLQQLLLSQGALDGAPELQVAPIERQRPHALLHGILGIE